MISRQECAGQRQVDVNFKHDYAQLRREFDKLENADSFQGPQLEALTQRFMRKWEPYIEELTGGFPAQVCQLLKHRDLSACTHIEALEDDLRLCQSLEVRYKSSNDKHANYWNNYLHPELDADTCEPNQLASDIYRRACEAAYLRLTYNRARLNLEEDRQVPVSLGQRAFRYDPHNIKSCLWLSVSLGWCSNAMTNPRVRSLSGETFKRLTQRTLTMEPQDGLANHLLGIYYFHVGGLNWIQRSIAKNLLGVKVEGGYAESELHFRRVLEVRDDWLPSGLWMAKVIQAQGRPADEVRHWIKFGLKQEALEPTTELDRAELHELARRFKIVVDEKTD